MIREVIATTLLVLALPASAAADDAAIAAVALPEIQFRSFLAQVVFKTQTVVQGAFSLGVPANCAVVKPAFEAAIAKHLPAWRANLVAAHRANVPVATLDAAAAAGAVAGGKMLVAYRDKVGAVMQTTSKPLLKAAASDVLKPVFEAATKNSDENLDFAQRQRELSAAMDDGTLYCGLQPVGAEAR